MIKRRARQAGLPMTTCCHTFRATGITNYLQNDGTIQYAQQTPAPPPALAGAGVANHELPRTPKLYDCTHDGMSEMMPQLG